MKIVQTYTTRLTILKANIIKIEINLRNKLLYNFYNNFYIFIIIDDRIFKTCQKNFNLSLETKRNFLLKNLFIAKSKIFDNKKY